MSRKIIACVSDSPYLHDQVKRVIRRYIGVNQPVSAISYTIFEIWANNIEHDHIKAFVLSNPTKDEGVEVAKIAKETFSDAAMIILWTEVDLEVEKAIRALDFDEFIALRGLDLSDRDFSLMLKRVLKGEPLVLTA